MQLEDTSYRQFACLLEQETGQTLADNRRWRIDSMLRPVMVRSGVASLADLANSVVLSEASPLRRSVVDSLLNNETSFFRDARTFEALESRVLNVLFERNQEKRSIRIWFAGCSTGQEAYSVAMLFAEHKQRWSDWTIDLVASDVSATAIERAASGIYSQFEIQRGLSVKRMIRWFDKVGEDWQALPALRDGVRFYRQDLRQGPPEPGPYDVIFCRNVMLYFDAERRGAFLDMFAKLLNPDGFLLLGAGETVIGLSSDFRSCPTCAGFHMRAAAFPCTGHLCAHYVKAAS